MDAIVTKETIRKNLMTLNDCEKKRDQLLEILQDERWRIEIVTDAADYTPPIAESAWDEVRSAIRVAVDGDVKRLNEQIEHCKKELGINQ